MGKIGDVRRRNLGIDAGRYALGFLVVLVHALSGNGKIENLLLTNIIKIACRAAVPFFFIASGSFCERSSSFSAQLVLKPLRRLMPIYVFWMFAYFLFLQIVPVPSVSWSFGLRDLLSGGAAFHLWFLPALGFALALVATGLKLFGTRITGLLCCGLALFSLADGAYHNVLHLAGSPKRGGLLVAPMFVYIGAMLARRAVMLRWPLLAVLVAFAYVLLVGEELMIASWAGAPALESHSFTFCTFLLGTAVFLLLRALPESKVVRGVASLGQISLAVYATHLFFLWLLLPIIGNDSVLSAVLVAAITFGSATTLSLLLRRIPIMQKFVM